ncbi:MAG: FtsH protease activity modulator HflK [Alphaproteobacteria bacterium]|nr:FtsH protease activity modulator HflK [Alphaproteobacteria bacterium]
MADKPSPWGNPENDNKNKEKKAPEWKPTPFPRKDDRADLEELLKKLKEKFNSFNGNGGRGKAPDAPKGVGKKVGLIVLVALIAWVGTGFYQIAPEEQGVVMRFGKYSYTTGPGLHYHLPYPIEEVLKPNVMRENRIEIGFRSSLSEYRRLRSLSDAGNVRSVPRESLMLTGDENIVEVNYTVTWKINDAGDFLFNLRDPVGTVRMAAESAMREVVGQTPIQKVITGGREKIQDETRKKLQAMMDQYKAGVQISAVQMLKVDPPSQVIDAFNDVQRAKADRERIRNEAEAYRNDIIPKARGEAAQKVQAAEAYKEQTINLANGDAQRFLSVMKEYRQAKEVTSRRMYIEAMEEVLGNVNKVIIDPSAKAGNNVVPYLPLTTLNQNTSKEGAK